MLKEFGNHRRISPAPMRRCPPQAGQRPFFGGAALRRANDKILYLSHGAGQLIGFHERECAVNKGRRVTSEILAVRFNGEHAVPI
jgi:hypothetical protein